MTQLIYNTRETELVFADSEQSPDVDLSLASLAADSAQVSNQHDLGATSSRMYEWRGIFQFATAPVVGEALNIYAAYGDTTYQDGGVGTMDSTLSSNNVLPNLHFIGSVVVDTGSSDVDVVASGIFTCSSRYISIVVHNNTSDELSSDAVNSVKLTPIPDQIQNDV